MGSKRVLSLCVAVLVFSSPAWAMGKKPTTTVPTPGGSCGTVGIDKTPKPVRSVVLKPMATKLFPLPNGSQVDLTSELNTMMMTAVAGTSTLQPVESAPGTPDECDSHIEIRAALTTLELNAFQLGLTFGYTPAGAYTGILPGGPGANGSLDVKVGLIGMDFSVWDCTGSRCAAVAASNANQSMTNVDLQFTINLATVTGAGHLVYNTQLGKILRAILEKGITDLSNSDRINDLPWHAFVRDYMPESGSVIFDAGSNDRIAGDQTFTVFASQSSAGACDVFKPVAYVHTVQVDAVSSTATIDQVTDAAKPQAGDVVMIRRAPK